MESAKLFSTVSVTAPNAIVISRKHWAAYLYPSLLIFLSLFFSLLFGYFLLLGAIMGIHYILRFRSISWTLTNEDLIIQRGYLPWTKFYYSIPLEDIYEAYYRHGLAAKLFNYGHLAIRRTDGTTTAFTDIIMDCHDEFIGTTNSLVRQLKKLQYQPAAPINIQANFNITSELKELATLREKGLLSEAEFEQIKQRAIGRK